MAIDDNHHSLVLPEFTKSLAKPSSPPALGDISITSRFQLQSLAAEQSWALVIFVSDFPSRFARAFMPAAGSAESREDNEKWWPLKSVTLHWSKTSSLKWRRLARDFLQNEVVQVRRADIDHSIVGTTFWRHFWEIGNMMTRTRDNFGGIFATFGNIPPTCRHYSGSKRWSCSIVGFKF